MSLQMFLLSLPVDLRRQSGVARNGAQRSVSSRDRRCPDGASLVAESDARELANHALYAAEQSTRSHRRRPADLLTSTETLELKPYITTPSPSALLTTAWHPAATSADASSYAYFRSIRDAPIHLLDGFTGALRASYPIIDHRERFIGPHSLCFSRSDHGQTLYAGHENALEIFDISRDGAEGERVLTTPTRGSRDGQKGILSSLSISPVNPNFMAAGSFNRTVGLYDLSSGGADLVQVFKVSGGGVTQLAFHPNETQLFVASRMHDEIEVWDLRNAATLLRSYARPGMTNQRLHFDIDAWGRYLVAGDQNGIVSIYDLNIVDQDAPLLTFSASKGQSRRLSSLINADAIGSVAFHPYLPLVLAASGSRDLDTSFAESWRYTTSEVSEAQAEREQRIATKISLSSDQRSTTTTQA